MAELKCVVENCTYNNDKCCCKGDIMVGGKEAQKENDTCCESFKDRTGETPRILAGLSASIAPKQHKLCVIHHGCGKQTAVRQPSTLRKEVEL